MRGRAIDRLRRHAEDGIRRCMSSKKVSILHLVIYHCVELTDNQLMRLIEDAFDYHF